MNFTLNLRDRRNLLAPPHYPFANYCTDTKSEMKTTFGDELFFNSLYLGPDPLRKNLADTIITKENMAAKNNKNNLEKEREGVTEENTPMHVDYSPLSGITNFFSGVLNVISNAMFNKRKPDSCQSGPEMAVPSMWQGAKILDENKILQDEISNDNCSETFASEMSDCHSAAAQCQSKLDKVRVLLSSSKPVPCSVGVRRRPKKVFVKPNSVEDCFEDAFSPEDFENLPNDSYIEYLSPTCCEDQLFYEIEAPKIKIQSAASPEGSPHSLKVLVEPINLVEQSETHRAADNHAVKEPSIASDTSKDSLETTEITATPKINVNPKMTVNELQLGESLEIVKNVPESNITNNRLENDTKKDLIESCEDKITKLKLLLKERCKKPKIITEPVLEAQPETMVSQIKLEPDHLASLPPRPKPCKVKDKRFKNPNRTNIKRKKSRMKKNIDDDMFFANEINSEELSSVENSPSTNNMENYMRLQPSQNYNHLQKPTEKEYFDEVCGRFHSSSVDSDDSFQIVFNDSPKYRRQSDCDSEDSFIFFEDSPDSCYTSNDVFGDTSDSEDCDSDSDMSDSGCGVFKLSASLSKSVSNLADDSLYVDYSEDEVDCAKVHDLAACDTVSVTADGCDSKGLLLTDRKKLKQKDLPSKRVHFSTEPPKVHVMRVWLFAAKQTRQRYWEQFVVDRERFKRRIDDVDMAVSWVLKPQHRSRVMFQRFMPWWNAQKRQAIAENKEREAQEKERLKREEIDKENTELNKNVNVKTVNEEELGSADDAEVIQEGDQKGESNSTAIMKAKTDNVEGNMVIIENNNVDDRISGEERMNNDSLVNKDIDSQNPKENTEANENERENKSVSIENIKNNNRDSTEAYNSQILPYNEKILNLNSEYVNGILDT